MITRLASRVFVLVIIGIWWGVSSASIYSFDRTVGGGTIIGSLTTDGTLGELSAGNILTWDFDITLGTYTTNFLSSDPSTFFQVLGTDGSGLIATAGGLTFDAGSTGSRGFSFYDTYTSWALCNAGVDLGGVPCTDGIASEWLFSTRESDDEADHFLASIETSGQITVASLAPVPIPAAAWLFGSALVGLVGIARRKKAA